MIDPTRYDVRLKPLGRLNGRGVRPRLQKQKASPLLTEKLTVSYPDIAVVRDQVLIGTKGQKRSIHGRNDRAHTIHWCLPASRWILSCETSMTKKDAREKLNFLCNDLDYDLGNLCPEPEQSLSTARRPRNEVLVRALPLKASTFRG